jgi:hypothetical protein
LSSTRHQVNRCDRIFGTHLTYDQYKADRGRRTLRGIDEQVAKAEQAVAGKAPVKRNRLIELSGGTKSVNRELEETLSQLGSQMNPGALTTLK